MTKDLQSIIEKIVELINPVQKVQMLEDEHDYDIVVSNDNGKSYKCSKLEAVYHILTTEHYNKYIELNYIQNTIQNLYDIVIYKRKKINESNEIITENQAINELYKITNVLSAIDVYEEDDNNEEDNEGNGNNGAEKVKYNILDEGAAIIGENGCGKTTLAKAICKLTDGCLIPANKNTAIASLIPIKKTKTSINVLEYNKALESIADDNTRLILRQNDSCNEFERIISEMLQGKLSKIMETNNITITTEIDEVIELWNDILRTGNLNSHKLFINKTFELRIKQDVNDTTGYDIAGMSDGEKDTLFIIAKVIYEYKLMGKKIVIVDEPEIHIHKSVLPILWTKLEQKCNCPFIYFSHDIDFVETRNCKKFWLKKCNYNTNALELHPIGTNLPTELYKIIGKNILFCEGKIDHRLYSVLFPNRIVIIAHNCDNVKIYTKVYNEKHLGQSIGIIDRDYHSDIYKPRNKNIFVLNVAEVENLFIQADVLKEYIKDDDKVRDIKRSIAEKLKEELPTISREMVRFQIAFENNLGTTIEKQQNILEEIGDVVQKIQQAENELTIIADNVINNLDNDEYYQALIKVYNKKGVREIVEKIVGVLDFKDDILTEIENDENSKLKQLLAEAFPDELKQLMNNEAGIRSRERTNEQELTTPKRKSRVAN